VDDRQVLIINLDVAFKICVSTGSYSDLRDVKELKLTFAKVSYPVCAP
jgi:hypothetical protein